MASLILKNGVVSGWANTTCVIGGVIITGIKSIDFGYSQKKENIYGQGKNPVGRGRGNNEFPDATIDILLEEWKALVLAAPNNDPTQIPMFSIPITYDNGIPPEILNNAEFTGVKQSKKQGDTANWVVVGIVWAGLTQ
jgi:hypothetical protein